MWRYYYYAGSQRIAMRVRSSSQNQLYYLFGDHLGSLNLTVNSNDEPQAKLRYYPFGAERWSDGTQQTALTFTGQRSDDTAGMLWVGSRWYDASLARWAQPDTIVPLESQGVQAWDRYAYANNSPSIYSDPSGHDVGCPGYSAERCGYSISNPALVPDNLVVPEELPTQITEQPAILLWVYLYNSETGRPYADFIKENKIEVKMSSKSKSLAQRGQKLSINMTDKLMKSFPPNKRSVITTAASLGHEAYHTMRPFVVEENSKLEEFFAYQHQDEIMQELSLSLDMASYGTGLNFSINPLSTNQLQSWFSDNAIYFGPIYEDINNYPPFITPAP